MIEHLDTRTRNQIPYNLFQIDLQASIRGRHYSVPIVWSGEDIVRKNPAEISHLFQQLVKSGVDALMDSIGQVEQDAEDTTPTGRQLETAAGNYWPETDTDPTEITAISHRKESAL